MKPSHRKDFVDAQAAAVILESAIGRINQGVTHTPLAPDDPIS